MKRIVMIAWLASVVLMTKLSAEVKLIDGMPFSESNGLRLYADVGQKSSIEIAGLPKPESPGEWWTIRAYIQNIGSEPISVLLGRDSNVLTGFPDSTSINVGFRILSEVFVGELTVKPPVGDFRPVTLEPGEVAQLPIANVQLKERGKVRKIKITYAVDSEYMKWFKVWSGEIELLLDKDRPPKK